jgi:hypothetical protein
MKKSHLNTYYPQMAGYPGQGEDLMSFEDRLHTKHQESEWFWALQWQRWKLEDERAEPSGCGWKIISLSFCIQLKESEVRIE